MNKLMIALVSLLSLAGCASSYTETVRTPTGTQSVQTVSNGFSRDTVVHKDTERAYWERCMANRAPQNGSANADRECAAEGTYGPMGGYGLGYGYGGMAPGMGYETPGSGAVYGMGATGTTVITTGTQAGSAPNGTDNAQNTILDDHEQRLKKIEKKKPAAKK